EDLIDGLIRLMNSADDLAGPVNLGNPVECTMRELAETVVALTGSGSRIEYRPRPSDDPEKRRPDISLARSLLGWEPQVPLVEGLTATIDYFRQRRNGMHAIAAGSQIAPR